MKNHQDNLHKLRRLSEANGTVIIKDKLVEELHELLVALEDNDEDAIHEEMADVTVLLVQYRMAEPVSSTVIDDIVERKIARTIERLKLDEDEEQEN